MNWAKVINSIKNRGITSSEIAAAVGVSKATINRIQSGFITKVEYSVGLKLLGLQGGAKMRR